MPSDNDALVVGFPLRDEASLVVAVASDRICIGEVHLRDAVYSDVPYGPVAEAGVYNAVSNRHGAVSVVLDDGGLLGVKPSEYEPV